MELVPSRKIAITGTFDVANYGDLLFPLIVKKRLKKAGYELYPFSPIGGQPWEDSLMSQPIDSFIQNSNEYRALMIGGGNIIHANQTSLPDYKNQSTTAYANLWLTAASAMRENQCILWNAPGVSEAINEDLIEVVKTTLNNSTYITVRDEQSKSLLLNCSPKGDISVVPDTAWTIGDLWSEEELLDTYCKLFDSVGLNTPEKSITIHLNKRYLAGRTTAETAEELSKIAEYESATMILVATGPCHGDDTLISEIASQLKVKAFIAPCNNLKKVTACFANSDAYIGSSYHGFIVSTVFNKPAVLIADSDKIKFKGLIELYPAIVSIQNTFSEAILELTRLRSQELVAIREAIIKENVSAVNEHFQKIQTKLNAHAPRKKFKYPENITHTILKSQSLKNRVEANNLRLEIKGLRKDQKRKLEDQKRKLEDQKRKLEDQKRKLIYQNKGLNQQLEIEQDRVSRMQNSGSWKYTSIFRALRRLVSKKRTQKSGKRKSKKSKAKRLNFSDEKVSLIIPIHNALEDVKLTLESIVHNLYQNFELILVDDGSTDETKDYLENFAQQSGYTTLIRNESPKGYTVSANIGLKAAKTEFSVLMNSDIILTRQAIPQMLRCFEASAEIAMAGPLSNAASFQSIPELSAAEGGWSINQLPEGWSPQALADKIEAQITPTYPEVPILNGFCTMIRKTVFEKIGYLDEDAFPMGYGEENDFCIRAQKAGMKLVVADNAYVYHAKSKSFGSKRRSELNQKGNEILYKRHGVNVMKDASSTLKNSPDLIQRRKQASCILKETALQKTKPEFIEIKRVFYLLPAKGGGGGAHSVVQEAIGLRELGVFTRIATPAKYQAQIKHHYPMVEKELFYFYKTQEELYKSCRNYNVCVATIFTTVKWLKEIVAQHPHIQPAYYIQDYEPLFEPPGTPLNIEAMESYTLIPNNRCFAKTHWIIDEVKKHHGTNVTKVEASIDHDTYRIGERRGSSHITIAAMIRPQTPRRNAKETISVLRSIKEKYENSIGIHIFGCESEDPKFKALKVNFAHTNHGICERSQVSVILQASDIFVDFSAYQAFGRTGLEAMACLTAVILPKIGGVHEYAIDTQNALLVDTQDMPSMQSALTRLITDEALRNSLKENGLKTAQCYTIKKSCESIKEVLISKSTGD